MKFVCTVLVMAMCLSRGALAQDVLFVNETATGANDGSSWTDAYLEFDPALAFAIEHSSVTDIWVAAGTYRPTLLTEEGDSRSATFRPRAGLELWGGFAGDETSPEQREIIRHPTILDGLINPGPSQYHVYHVTTMPEGTGTRFDGFIIQNGSADGSDTSLNEDRGGGLVATAFTRSIVANCVFRDNAAQTRGAGAYAAFGQFNGPHIFFVNCFFQDNVAGDAQNPGDGGGVSVNFAPNSGAFEMTNCVFFRNVATGNGGGLHQTGSQTLLIRDCTFVENSADRAGGGIHSAASADLRNSILYYNTVGSSTSFASQITPTTSSIEYCCVQNLPSEANGNIDDPPEFAHQSGANLRPVPPRCHLATP